MGAAMPAYASVLDRLKVLLSGATRWVETGEGTVRDQTSEQAGSPNLLSLAVSDNTFYQGGSLSGLYRDRYEYDRASIVAECLRAWRVNPLARQIVKLTTAFVVGDGLLPISEHKGTNRF